MVVSCNRHAIASLTLHTRSCIVHKVCVLMQVLHALIIFFVVLNKRLSGYIIICHHTAKSAVVRMYMMYSREIVSCTVHAVWLCGRYS